MDLDIKHLIEPPCESILSTSNTLRLFDLHKSELISNYEIQYAHGKYYRIDFF